MDKNIGKALFRSYLDVQLAIAKFDETLFEVALKREQGMDVDESEILKLIGIMERTVNNLRWIKG